MVSMFENYEQQYSILTAEVTANIASLSASKTRDRRQLISVIEKNVREVKKLLEKMDAEVKEIKFFKKQRCKSKLDCYRAELKRLTLEYIKARSTKQVTFCYEDYSSVCDNQKQRLLENDNDENSEKNSSCIKLENAYKLLLETEETGTEIVRNSEDQRDTIQRSRSRLRETDEELNRVSRLLNSILFKAIQQKYFLLAILLFFLFLLGVVIFLKEYF